MAVDRQSGECAGGLKAERAFEFEITRDPYCNGRQRVIAGAGNPRLLDVVAVLCDIPEHGLVRGQVGTVIEILSGAYEVEFSDDEGKTYAELALELDQLLVLHHHPQGAA